MDLALFDFDGTLTRSDSFVPFLRFASSRLRWVVGSAVLLPISLGYRFGLLSAPATRQLASVAAFWRRRESELYRLGEEFSQEVIATNLRSETFDKLVWHKERGDRVVVVSASLDFYLQPWCEAHQVELICTRVGAHEGRLTGVFSGRDCSGGEKVRRIREGYELAGFDRIWAYGDTVDDLPMLQLADEKCFQGKTLESVAAAERLAR